MSTVPQLSSANLTQPRKRALSPSEKPKKKKKPRQRKRLEDDPNLDAETGVNSSIGKMDTMLLSDLVAQKLKKLCPDMTFVELEERRVEQGWVEDSSEFDQVRTLENLPAFVKKFSPTEPSKVPKQHGAPHTLVVAASGIRAADLVRALRTFQGDKGTIGKLFAKHLKLADQAKFLKGTKTNISVGTPKRLSDLITEEALSLQNLKRIVIDASHIDQKKRGILDMKDTIVPLAELLNQEPVRKFLEGDGKVLFY